MKRVLYRDRVKGAIWAMMYLLMRLRISKSYVNGFEAARFCARRGTRAK